MGCHETEFIGAEQGMEWTWSVYVVCIAEWSVPKTGRVDLHAHACDACARCFGEARGGADLPTGLDVGNVDLRVLGARGDEGRVVREGDGAHLVRVRVRVRVRV